MGAVASGLAFGAGMELMRGMFSGKGGEGGHGGEGSISPYILPFILSGLSAYGSHKLLFGNMKRKGLYTALVFGGVFVLSSGVLGERPEGSQEEQGAQH